MDDLDIHVRYLRRPTFSSTVVATFLIYAAVTSLVESTPVHVLLTTTIAVWLGINQLLGKKVQFVKIRRPDQ